MRLSRVAAIVIRIFYLMRGSPARILPLFVWVGVDIILWGFITRYLNGVASPGFNFVPTLLGAVLLWDFFGRVMQGVATAFLEDVWSRNFLNIFATPLYISEYIAGLVVSTILTSIVGLFVMLVLAAVLFGLSVFSYGLLLIPFLLVLFLFGISAGVFAISLVMRLGPAAEWFVWPIPALLSPFIGVFYPLSTLPHWMQIFARILPPSYVFEGIRGIIAGHRISEASLLLAASLALFYVFLANWYFTSVYRRAVRTGLIARYSAETVS